MRRTAIALLAREEGLDLLEPPDVNCDDAVSAVQAARPDAICVVEFGQLVRQAFAMRRRQMRSTCMPRCFRSFAGRRR